MLKWIIAHIPSWYLFLQAAAVGLVPYGVSRIGAKLNAMAMFSQPNGKPRPPEEEAGDPLTGNFDDDLAVFEQWIENYADVGIRNFELGVDSGIKAAVIYAEGLSDRTVIDRQVLQALMNADFEASPDVPLAERVLRRLPVLKTMECGNVRQAMGQVLIGWAALIVDGVQGAFMLGVFKGVPRQMDEPESEGLIRGARVGFNENLHDNTAILRRFGENQSLFILKMKVGRRAKRNVAIAYIEDVADPAIVEEVKKRLSRIDLDSVPESGYIEQMIEDSSLSPFPQIQSTERPDRVFGALMEGRVAVLLAGTPFALIVPATLSMFLQSPEDYFERWLPGTMFRLLRFFALMVSLLAPSLYISFISFHPGLIPTKLTMSIIGSRVNVPFTALVEALILEVSIELLREAGLRLPKPIGPAMGIVGGLVIGEAAVQAGIVSPILVIVIAVTAISSFAIPHYNIGLSFRMLRFVSMFCAGVFGLFGVIMFFLALCIHLVNLRSFGVPYAGPLVSYQFEDWKDFLVRAPLAAMKRRPQMLKPKQPIRKG
ncbi:spore germination protein [Cohnella sp. CIP 111063]|uniref:spore germination protein n=1 Tax=unclassified Cohnella TaxID=2636738 RepID=UPI000B8C2558|nr:MULTISPECIES: spore germination protein [unclassified Cohnella]OXS53050.1 spore germination protein [Cohnella sp. CIP 111063]PRX60556.1 spore germination protein [Cohnella sp. SGD-V74]